MGDQSIADDREIFALVGILQESGGGPLVWAPGLDGVVVASMRGGDFLFESGQDLSIGYDSHERLVAAGIIAAPDGGGWRDRPSPFPAGPAAYVPDPPRRW